MNVTYRILFELSIHHSLGFKENSLMDIRHTGICSMTANTYVFTPDFRIALHLPCIDHNAHVLLDEVFTTTYDTVFMRGDGSERGWRVQSEGFTKDSYKDVAFVSNLVAVRKIDETEKRTQVVVQPTQVVPSDCFITQHFIDFLAKLSQNLRILHDMVQSKCKGTCCGFEKKYI